MYPHDITSPFSPEKVHFKKRCFAINNQGLFFPLINIISGGILLSVDVNLERPRRVLKRKASSARPSKRTSLTLFNQICNLQNSSTPFFHKHHLELGTGGSIQKYPSIYAKLLQSCKPQQLQREGLAGFAEFFWTSFGHFFLGRGGGGGNPSGMVSTQTIS